MLKRLMLVGAVAVMAVAVVGSGAAVGAPAAPVEMSYACALKAGGLMRYVTSPSKCSSKLENAVTIKPGPVKTCVLPGGLVYRTAGGCSVRGSRLLTLPASSAVYFCALKVVGTLRSVSSPTQCSKLEFAVVVTPSGADLSLTVFTNVQLATQIDVVNGGPAAVTATVHLTATGHGPVGYGQGDTCTDSSTITISGGTLDILCVVSLAPGEQAFLALVNGFEGSLWDNGVAEVTSAGGVPDPDSTPNNHVTTEDDYATFMHEPIGADISVSYSAPHDFFPASIAVLNDGPRRQRCRCSSPVPALSGPTPSIGSKQPRRPGSHSRR